MTFYAETLYTTNKVAIVRITDKGVKLVYRFREGDTCIVTNAQGNKSNASHAGRTCVIESFPHDYSWDQKAKVRYLDTNRLGKQELYNLKPVERSPSEQHEELDNLVEFIPKDQREPKS